MINEETKKNIADAAKNMLNAWNASESTVDSVAKYCLEKRMEFSWKFYIAVSAYAKDMDMWCGSDNAPLVDQ